MCAIAPIRAGDELLTHYGIGYWLAILHTLQSEVQREAIITDGRFSELEIFTVFEASLAVSGPPLGATSLRLTLVMKRLRKGNPPFQDYWNKRAMTLLPGAARKLLHDARTVLAAGGLTRRRYTESDTLLQQLILLDRLRGNGGEVARVQNGSRSWGLAPALFALGLQWNRSKPKASSSTTRR